MTEITVRYDEATRLPEYTWQGHTYSHSEMLEYIKDVSKAENSQLKEAFSNRYLRNMEGAPMSGSAEDRVIKLGILFTIQVKGDVKLLENAFVQVLKFLFFFLNRVSKEKPRKPESQLMWRARKKAERHLRYWIDEQDKIKCYEHLKARNDVARQVFEKASELFKIKPIDYKAWERGVMDKPIERCNPLYRQFLCRWFVKAMKIVFAMGTPKWTVLLSPSRTQNHLKHLRAIAKYQTALIRKVKQCLSDLTEHGTVWYDLNRAWDEQMPLELLYPMLPAKIAFAFARSLEVSPMPTDAPGDQEIDD